MSLLRRALTSLLVALLAAVLALAGLVLVGAPAQACSCAMEGPRGAIDRADAVFAAAVLDRSVDGRGLASYDVRVQRVYKGEPVGDVVVTSSASGASCGLEGVSPGRTQLFLVTGSGSAYAGNLCLGFGVSEGDARRLLGPPAESTAAVAPTPPGAVTDGGGIGVRVDDDPRWPWVLGGGLGLVLLVLALRRVLVGSWR
ncbi:hypothetical protein [Nocardioides psychrotolerans]|uniref:hypothetical protein n=1 Tax=Nocardioides psychrotolerans TaxID=1005945 RepID=UPI003137FF3C